MSENQTAARAVNLYLIKPSSYDDEGYIVRYFRGVLPSNTLFCLAALTESAGQSRDLAGIKIKTTLIDECVMRVDVEKICRPRYDGSQTVICLVGVQTHQYPRAADLARQFRQAGLPVLIGGFHVSGILSMIPGTPPDLQELMDIGVTIVKGEVEETWNDLLKDAISDNLLPLYDFTSQKPALDSAPIPVADQKVLKRFVSSKSGTIDCGRGCPFNCSFCTIINVQGRKMRFRSPEKIAATIRENYWKKGVKFYFFTDDNFARNKNWRPILEELIKLREEEEIPVEFMMQVDTLSHRTKGFVEIARRAGCSNVFIGMESINDDNLKVAGKNQNHVDDFRNLIQAYRDADIATHVGYILGFPFDTPESIRNDVTRLMNEIGVDMASFFILTPLPGSKDHLEMVRAGAYMDPDYNKYDSFHETLENPHFPGAGDLRASYEQAWELFYSFDNMCRVLKRASKRTYWNLFANFLWYKSAIFTERRHPMMAGFFRLKRRTEIRPGLKPLSRMAYLVKRVKELRHVLVSTLQLLIEMQLLWLETRQISPAERRIMEELQQLKDGTSLRLRLSEIQTAYIRARRNLPQLHVPSRFRLFIRKWNPFSVSGGFYLSSDVLEFWNRALLQLQKGKLTEISIPVLVGRALQDLRLSAHFAAAWMRKSAAN